MAFIKNEQWRKICELDKNGDARAHDLVDHYVRMDYRDQADLDRMVSNLFNPEEDREKVAEAVEIAEEQPAQIDITEPNQILEQDPAEVIEVTAPIVGKEDITADLDRELEGMIDESKIDDISFADFLKNKKRDAERARKNKEYFAVFDLDGRMNYLANKKTEYGSKFDLAKRDIDRDFNDMDNAISKYSLAIGDLADDGVELSMDSANNVYDDILEINEGNHSLGRSWDEEDVAAMTNDLMRLVAKYGRKNVLAALNTLKNDNAAYRTLRMGKIDSAISDYGKALDGLLK